MSDWEIGTFKMKCAGRDGIAIDFTVAGQIKHPFALDPRRYDELRDGDIIERVGWVITHLPSGFIVRGVKANLSAAKNAAEALLSEADWDFTDPLEAKSRKETMQKVVKDFPCLCSASDFDSAIPLDWDGF